MYYVCIIMKHFVLFDELSGKDCCESCENRALQTLVNEYKKGDVF